MPWITLDSISTEGPRRKAAWGGVIGVAVAASFWVGPQAVHAQSIPQGNGGPPQVSLAPTGASYRLDPNHTSIQWEVQHFRTSTLRGRFQDVGGQIRIDPQAETGEVSMVLNVASVNTGVPALDSILRGDQFFDVKRYPQAFFVSRNLKFDAGTPSFVTGELTLRDASIPLTLRAVNFNCYENPTHGKTTCGGDFEAEMYRSSAGLGYGLPFVGDRVRLRIQVEAFKE